MTRVAYDHLPVAITAGEYEAILAANARGWITPPLYCSYAPAAERKWHTVHLRYLDRRGLIAEVERRQDGMHRFRLNAAGLTLRDDMTRLDVAA